MSAPLVEECCYGLPRDAGLYGSTSAGVLYGSTTEKYDILAEQYTVEAGSAVDPDSEDVTSECSDDTIDNPMMDVERFEPPVLLDYGHLCHHLGRMQLLADQLRAAHMLVIEKEAQVETTLKKLWEANPDLRRRGLRGGAARKAKHTKGKYTPIRDMCPKQNQRRLYVEKQDQRDRGRIQGLRYFRKFFEHNLERVKYQTGECDWILGREQMTKCNGGQPCAYDVELADDLLHGEMVESIEEIEATLKVFYTECDL